MSAEEKSKTRKRSRANLVVAQTDEQITSIKLKKLKEEPEGAAAKRSRKAAPAALLDPDFPSVKGADTSSSAPPSPNGSSSSALARSATASPSNPLKYSKLGANQRGYVIYFYWKEHYEAQHGSGTGAVARPARTEMVASIPGLFHRLFATLQTVHRDSTGADLAPLIERKLLRPKERGTERKQAPLQTITDGHGNEYQVTACRKEHVELLFDGPEGGILKRLGLCPHLLDIFVVSPGGKSQCMGGLGKGRYDAQTAAKITYKCSCDTKFEPSVHPDYAPGSGGLDDGAEDDDEELASHMSQEASSSSSSALLSVPLSAALVSDPSSSSSSSSSSSASSSLSRSTSASVVVPVAITPIAPASSSSFSSSSSSSSSSSAAASSVPFAPPVSVLFGQPPAVLFAAGTTAPAAAASSSASSSSSSSSSSSHSAPATSSAVSAPVKGVLHQKQLADEAGVEIESETFASFWKELQTKVNETKASVERSWRQKLAHTEQEVEKMQARVREADAHAKDWQQRWQAERDHNLALSDRLVALQKQVERMAQHYQAQGTSAASEIAAATSELAS